ncbi:MAG: hypothetical protein JWP37_1097 [Mucilaginibacter sp.]|nr:hypothetical protein [Mucilaginibacter sp.]
MKHIILFLFLITFSISAFAQFPLGSDRGQIKAYFAENIPYASVQQFKAENGANGLCFTKVKVVGDYTFYFDYYGKCSSYVVTYDNSELPEVITRFDSEFCREEMARWSAHDKTFDVTLVRPTNGENFFSMIYKPASASMLPTNALAAN